jgi:hypothetical protein
MNRGETTGGEQIIRHKGTENSSRHARKDFFVISCGMDPKFGARISGEIFAAGRDLE